MIFEQKSEVGKGVSPADIWDKGNHVLGRGEHAYGSLGRGAGLPASPFQKKSSGQEWLELSDLRE